MSKAVGHAVVHVNSPFLNNIVGTQFGFQTVKYGVINGICRISNYS